MDKKQKFLINEYKKYHKDIDKAIKKVLLSGRYILGKELERFEERFADLVGTKYSIGVGNGYDALYISCRTVGVRKLNVYIHKELHISTTNAVYAAGGILVHSIDKSDIVIPVVSPKTGDDRFFNKIIIEDACQSIGMNRKVPTNVSASCYSFHPLKLLHCYGDGGAIAVNDKELYKDIKEFRNHGRIGKTFNYSIGVNSRLDEIQAAVLNVMMDKIKL